MLLSLAAVIVCLGIGLGVFLLVSDSQPIPKNIQKSVSFSLYYPSSLPKGYTHKTNSSRQETGIVFYNFVNDKRTISVSQQALSSNPPSLEALAGFTKLEVPAGKAAVGANSGSPTVIILTNTSIITINGSVGTPQDVVANIAKSMTSLPE
jgi:hypothetical protein